LKKVEAMKYERFEDLPVWQLAADLAVSVFEWTQQPSFRGKGDLANQIQRAALSISNNIAEGFERGSTKELLFFCILPVARQVKFEACCALWRGCRASPV
jgi:hypothetical protein